MLQKYRPALEKYKKILILISIVLVFSFFWRFANYGERWTLSQDQARDGIIGLYMIEHHTIPLVGPPSSAGNFSFGPYYYWMIGLFTLLSLSLPIVNGPWIGFTLLSVATPVVFFFIGKHFGGKTGGLFFGFTAAFASELIFHATDMLNPVPISFVVSLLFLWILKIVDQKNIFYSLAGGAAIGIAVNFHYQALGLLILIPLLSLINDLKPKQKLTVFGLSLVGFFLTSIPLIIFNILHQNSLFHHLLQFVLGDQTPTGATINLFNDLLIFWPQLWGTVIAHLPLFGYVFLLLFMLALVFAIGDFKTLKKSFSIIVITFLFQIIFLSIYQGVRSPVYLIVFHSFFVFFSGWIILNFYRFNKTVGLVLFLLVILSTIPQNLQIVENNNSQVSAVLTIKRNIDRQVGGNLYLLSDQHSNMISLPLHYLYLKDHRIDYSANGIIVCSNRLVKEIDGVTEKWSCPMDSPLLTELDNYRTYRHGSLTDLQQKSFQGLHSSEVYEQLFEPYKK